MGTTVQLKLDSNPSPPKTWLETGTQSAASNSLNVHTFVVTQTLILKRRCAEAEKCQRSHQCSLRASCFLRCNPLVFNQYRSTLVCAIEVAKQYSRAQFSTAVGWSRSSRRRSCCASSKSTARCVVQCYCSVRASAARRDLGVGLHAWTPAELLAAIAAAFVVSHTLETVLHCNGMHHSSTADTALHCIPCWS
jgi:hypothetical protein